MATKPESGANPLDTVKLILALAILMGGIAAYYFYTDLPIYIRSAAVLAGAGLAVTVVMQTDMGRDFWRFVQGSRIELRKVVWPNRQEATQTTLAVIVFAILMGVFFWALDMFLLWATKSLVGRGG